MKKSSPITIKLNAIIIIQIVNESSFRSNCRRLKEKVVISKGVKDISFRSITIQLSLHRVVEITFYQQYIEIACGYYPTNFYNEISLLTTQNYTVSRTINKCDIQGNLCDAIRKITSKQSAALDWRFVSLKSYDKMEDCLAEANAEWIIC